MTTSKPEEVTCLVTLNSVADLTSKSWLERARQQCTRDAADPEGAGQLFDALIAALTEDLNATLSPQEPSQT